MYTAAILIATLASAAAFSPSRVAAKHTSLAFSPKIFDKAVDEWKTEYQVDLAIILGAYHKSTNSNN
jgi:hypothetical protein